MRVSVKVVNNNWFQVRALEDILTRAGHQCVDVDADMLIVPVLKDGRSEIMYLWGHGDLDTHLGWVAKPSQLLEKLVVVEHAMQVSR